jgi:hypothetical protein
LSTGNSKNQTYLSASTTNSGGILPNNSYNRYNFTARNTTNFLNDRLTLVSPKSVGLEAYWRFNEGQGNVFEDATGKGHTLTTSATPTWIDGILSTDKATEWK